MFRTHPPSHHHPPLTACHPQTVLSAIYPKHTHTPFFSCLPHWEAVQQVGGGRLGWGLAKKACDAKAA